ncbi:MAG: glycosyltransferase [Verrucomicrobiota bacterium]
MPAFRLPEPRTLTWVVSLAVLLITALGWTLLPTLDALPVLRVVLFAIMGISMLGLVFCFPGISDKRSILLIVGAAILLRLVLLPAPESDDVHRYIWEGRLVAAGENPFAAPADDEMWTSLRDEHWELMNHRDRPTAYPPGMLWLMSKVAPAANPVLAFKLLALAGDLATLGMLILLLKRQALPLRWTGFYAFNPLVTVAFAAEAHFDSLMIAALVGCLLAASSHRQILALTLLALAVHIKFIALILLPFLLIRAGNWNKKPARELFFAVGSSVAFTLLLAAATLPFIKLVGPWFEGLFHFVGTSAFNGPLFTLISLFGLTPDAVRPLCYAAFAIGFATLLVARFKGLDLIDSFHVALTLLLLCSPIVHFWYLAWLIPLTALRPSFGWSMASITMAGYFLAWRTLEVHGWWGYGHVTAAILWTPVMIAFAAQHRQLLPRMFHRFKIRSAEQSKGRLGIVIPTLNPGPELNQLLQQIERDSDAPIVVADASQKIWTAVAERSGDTAFKPSKSHDRSEASELPKPVEAPFQSDITARRLALPPKLTGRGNQIDAGIKALDTEWILVAHADTIPHPDWCQVITEAILNHPKAAMFVFGQRFDTRNRTTLLIEILNEIRIVFGGVAFGDQTMIIRRSALESSGGFPAQPLMEDVEVSLRLHTRGRLVYLGREWTVSAKKWQQAAKLRFRTVIRFVATYQLARLRGAGHAATCSERLYREYYPKNSA